MSDSEGEAKRIRKEQTNKGGGSKRVWDRSGWWVMGLSDSVQSESRVMKC